MSIDPSTRNTLNTLISLTTQLKDAVGNDEIDKVLGKIYIRTEFNKDKTPELKIERGGFWHPIQALSRRFDSSSYVITAVSNDNKIVPGNTYKALQKLHNDMGKISETDLDSLLSDKDIAKLLKDKNITKETLKNSVKDLQKVIDRVRDHKTGALIINPKKDELQNDVTAKFNAIVLNWGSKVQAPATVVPKAPDIKGIEGTRDQVKALLDTAVKALEDARRASNHSVIENARKVAESAETQSHLLYEGAQNTLAQLKQQHPADSLKEAEIVVNDINRFAAEIQTQHELLVQHSDTSVTTLLDSVKAAKNSAEAQSTRVTDALKNTPTTLEEAQALGKTIEEALTIANAAADRAKEALTKADVMIKASERKPETLLQSFRNATSDLGACNKFAEEIGHAKITINDTILALQVPPSRPPSMILQPGTPEPAASFEVEAKRTRSPLPMPEGPKEKTTYYASDLVVPDWAKESLAPRTLQSLEGLINRLQGQESSFLEMKTRIEGAPDSPTKRSAERLVGECQKELSQVVEKLQTYLREPKATERNDRIRGLEALLQQYSNFTAKSYAPLNVEMRALFPRTQTAKVSIDDLFKQLGPDGSAFIKKFHDLETCLANDLLSVRAGGDLKKAITDSKGEIDALFAEWQKNPNNTHVAKANEIMDRTKAALDKQNADKVLSKLKEVIPHIKDIQEALDNCPETMLELRNFLVSLKRAMPQISASILLTSVTFEDVKQAQSNSLAILLLSKKHEQLKNALFADPVDPDLQPVAAFVKRLIPSSVWLTEIQKDASFQFAAQEAQAQATPVAEAFQPPVAAPLTVETAIAKHQAILQRFKLPNTSIELSGAFQKVLPQILKEFEAIEGGYLTPTEYAKSGWWASNSGTLARGSYVRVFNELDKFEARELTPANIDRLGQLLSAVSDFIELKSTKPLQKLEDVAVRRQAKVAVQLMELHNFVSKVESFLNSKNQLNAETKATISSFYQKLGGKDLFSKDELSQWNVEKVDRVMNEIITEAKKFGGWDKFIQLEDGTNIQPSDSLIEELSLHMIRLRF